MEQENIKHQFNKLIKQLNQRKYNRWYNLKDLVELKAISYKSLKNMVGEIYRKYEPQGTIKKIGRSYSIHYSILDAFKLKQPRVTTIYSHEWKSNISWTTREFYDKEYHEYLISVLKNKTKGVNYFFAIELDSHNRNHVHILADAEPNELRSTIYQLMEFYIGNKNYYKYYCEPVYNTGSSVDYLIKNPQEINLI